MAVASELRDRGHGRVVTYSRKVFIPLTNLCRQKCGYCTFARGPRDPIAHTMSPDEVLAVARAGARQGCKEALFSLGERPEEIYENVRADLAGFGQRQRRRTCARWPSWCCAKRVAAASTRG
jgi:FO synthase